MVTPLSREHPRRRPLILAGLAAAIAFTSAGPAVAQNLDFETGTLRDWLAIGSAFDNQPTFGDNIAARRPGEASGHAGDWWIGTFENRPGPASPAGGAQGDEPLGTLISESFLLRRPYLHFLVGGGADVTRVRVELLVEIRPWETPPPMRADGVGGRIRLDDDDYTVRVSAAGNDEEAMRRVVWDVSADAGRKARILVSDNSSGPWGHINVDDFQFSDTPPPVAAVPRSARFRLTATGFRVVHQSYDNIFQADGRDDEVYVRSDVFGFDRTGALHASAVPTRTLTMGQGQPIRAGSGQPGLLDADRDVAGLVTGDTYPTATPWLARSGGPRPNDLPMTIWEGEITEGENGVVIVPSIWEWDGPDESVEEQHWGGELLSAVVGETGTVIGRIGNWPAPTPPVLEDIYSLRIRDRGTRPIGSSRPENVRMAADAVLLTYASARAFAGGTFTEAGATAPLPQGVLPFDLVDGHDMRGHYRLFLHLEQLP